MIEESMQGAITVIGSDEPLTVENVADAAAALQRCFGDGPPMAVLNMARITLLDSVGLELLLNAHDSFAERGGAFKLAAANPLCEDVLSVTGVGDELELYDEVTLAVRSFLR